MLRRSALVPAVGLLALGIVFAQEKPKYKPHDMARPRPPVVEPGTASTPEKAGKPPADAVVLFDGTDLTQWKASGKKEDDTPKWKVENGYFEVVPRTGGMETRRKDFADAQFHFEWATPAEVKGKGQGRGNSGINLGGFGEIQVLDSFENDTYPDGQAGGLYGKFPPLVNASRKPGEWQSYDIVTQLAKVDADGKVVRPARITVLHNGVLIHHAAEFGGKFGPFGVNLQDHGNPVRYRNVWVRKVRDYDEPADGKKE
ncbi:3-keto-disaccharide hydrolase [Limnoglobus roseus]|uniref:Putative beta-jelly-roll-type glycoside hydrolase n=1 Tax=Limnoglobus roseus TaxID=2598579 RepID=A0A5C1A664_9BACT|nr:DUF1080 domain-containing protein [Limnoglobus roseus]QEL13823.1 putative beta-jelly-roll-type glycoside hydrolase [Limnoglobus roseus]